jgi:pimeloyl-ACP methyl ester carboxylesterase
VTRSAATNAAVLDHAAILLLHGQPGRASDWDPLVAAIDGCAPVLVIDRPGWDGKSAAGGIARSADAAIAALDAAGIDRATIGGHSYGAAVAAWIAVSYPERVHSLVLVAPAANVASLARIDRLLAAPVAGYLASAALLVAGGLMLGAPVIRRRLAAAMAVREEYLRAAGPLLRGRATWNAFFTEQRALVHDLPALEAQMHRITAPVTIVIGTADSIVSARSARLLASQLASAQLIEIEHGRHILPAQIPERLAELMLDASLLPVGVQEQSGR